MNADVERLVADSGELLAVSGLATTAGRWTTVLFQFSKGSLILGCEDDTDEVLASTDDSEVDTGIPIEELADLVGMTVEYAWELRNHRGYWDAFQLRFVDPSGHIETRQFEVAAPAIDVRRIDI